MNVEKFFAIEDHNIPFFAKVVPVGGRFGRKNCLVNEEKPMIEFYDGRYDQFITRYYLDNLNVNNGVILDGGIDEWYISAENLAAAVKWAKEMLEI